MMNHEDEFAPRVIREFYTNLDCPRSLTAWLLYANKEYDQLVNLEFNPDHYADPISARDSLAATKFLSKAEFLETSFNRSQVALEKFFEAEEQCRHTNTRILRGTFSHVLTPAIIENARRKISYVLGDFDPVDWIERCNWGPGATVSLRRHQCTAPTKFLLEAGITNSAYNFVAPFWDSIYPNWTPRMKIQESSKVVTVPKNAKTDRTIAIEPGLNLWFQKGIGELLKVKLKKAGIDLKDQSHNGRLARLGSLSNRLATIDFSAASDTVSRELVRVLIPRRWLLVLEAFRSSSCSVDINKPPIYLEKFSSMGNGFTFELESLIFWALAVVCTETLNVSNGTVSVFGDDVIINAEVADLYSKICADLGFKVNSTKSYVSGNYRESCGEHFFNGYNIKPIFQKESLNGKTALLKLANNIRRLSHRRVTIGCDRALYSCWRLLTDELGPNTPRISEGYGDVGIIENIDDPSVTCTRAKHGLEGYLVRIWAVHAAQVELSHDGLRLRRLQQIGSLTPASFRIIERISRTVLVLPHLAMRLRESEPQAMDYSESNGKGNSIPLPGKTKHAKSRVLVPRWYDLGPWV